jgi:hypothetical protein
MLKIYASNAFHAFMSHVETDFARQHFFPPTNKSKVGGNLCCFLSQQRFFFAFYHENDKERGRINDHFFHSFSTIGEFWIVVGVFVLGFFVR